MSKQKAKYRRVKTPSGLQMDTVECGAVSLGIILSFFGKYLSIEKLRQDCDIGRDGSKASNILKAGRLNQLKAKGYKAEVKDLYKVKFPAIIHWNFNHFLVLEGINQKYAFLNDPAVGKRKVTIDELSKAFTGVVDF